MAIYSIYMRSFAPWREFGQIVSPTTETFGEPRFHKPGGPTPMVTIEKVEIRKGGPFHGDGRGFSIDTTSPAVTSRINAILDVNLSAGTKARSRAWCDPSFGPKGIGGEGITSVNGVATTGVGNPHAKFSVAKAGETVTATITYSGSNPLVLAAPAIDAVGTFELTQKEDELTIVSTITGDQFPACESFIVDSNQNKIFLGGFAPDSKDQFKERLAFGGFLFPPEKIWFESEVVVKVDSKGDFQTLIGGGSGSNSSGPACEGLSMKPTEWNARIMLSIPTPSDAP